MNSFYFQKYKAIQKAYFVSIFMPKFQSIDVDKHINLTNFYGLVTIFHQLTSKSQLLRPNSLIWNSVEAGKSQLQLYFPTPGLLQIVEITKSSQDYKLSTWRWTCACSPRAVWTIQ